jgi:hypothetical protein
MTITVEVQLACNSAAFGGHYIADLPGAIEITAYFGRSCCFRGHGERLRLVRTPRRF